MRQKSAILLVSLIILFLSPLQAAEKQVRVTAEKAPIYAESNTDSYRIEVIRKGTILTLFTSGSPEEDWYYVSYRSPRWKSRVTGFIQASMVEEVSDKPEPSAEKPKPQEIPEKKVPEKKEEVQPEIAKPKIEKLEEPPEEVKPKPEKTEVKESVGTSGVQESKSYELPDSEQKEKSRPFLTIDTKQAETEGVEKKDKPAADITEKMPEKLEERVPPEVLAAKPEPEEKKESTKKEPPKTEKPKEAKPIEKVEVLKKEEPKEKKQVVPKIEPQKPPQLKKPRLPGEKPFLTMSLGYGPSAGSGFGGFIQLNPTKNLAIHAGAGYYPTTYFYSEHEWATDEVLYSAGIKYYLPFKSNWLRTYMNLQYGGISVEAVRIITGFWQYQYVYENIQKSLYGPSFLVGVELKLMNSIGLNGAIGISYNTTDWEYWERDYFLTAEVGLLFHLLW